MKTQRAVLGLILVFVTALVSQLIFMWNMNHELKHLRDGQVSTIAEIMKVKKRATVERGALEQRTSDVQREWADKLDKVIAAADVKVVAVQRSAAMENSAARNARAVAVAGRNAAEEQLRHAAVKMVSLQRQAARLRREIARSRQLKPQTTLQVTKGDSPDSKEESARVPDLSAVPHFTFEDLLSVSRHWQQFHQGPPLTMTLTMTLTRNLSVNLPLPLPLGFSPNPGPNPNPNPTDRT